MLASAKTIFWVAVLLVMVLYICGIFCTQMVGHQPVEVYSHNNRDFDMADFDADEFNNYQYFGTVPRSMFTLFNLVIMVEDIEFSRHVAEKQPQVILFFMGFVIVTSFGLMNVIV